MREFHSAPLQRLHRLTPGICRKLYKFAGKKCRLWDLRLNCFQRKFVLAQPASFYVWNFSSFHFSTRYVFFGVSGGLTIARKISGKIFVALSPIVIQLPLLRKNYKFWHNVPLFGGARFDFAGPSSPKLLLFALLIYLFLLSFGILEIFRITLTGILFVRTKVIDENQNCVQNFFNIFTGEWWTCFYVSIYSVVVACTMSS